MSETSTDDAATRLRAGSPATDGRTAAQPSPRAALAPVAGSWVVRPMGAGDLDAVIAIELEVYPFPWTHGNFADSLAAGYDARVVELDGALVGYWLVLHAPDVSHLLNLSLARRLHGLGHGARLLAAMLDGVRAAGSPAVLLEVRPSNVPALRLYERAGFRRIGVRRGYYPAAEGRREDAIVMRLELA